MRIHCAIAGFLFLSTLCFAFKEPPLDVLIQRADAAKLNEQPTLYAKIAEIQLKAADSFYTDGKNEEARKALSDIVKYAGKSSDTALRSGKKLKKTEISLRKIAEKLRDIKRSVEFDEQAPIQDAIDHMEQWRSQLLTRMFGKGAK